MSTTPRLLAPLLAIAFTLSPLAASARVTRLEIASRELVAGGAPFGAAGPYEKLTGTVYFEVDPRNAHNAAVFDLDHAPRNARGLVEFSADAVILRPVDMRLGNGALLFEVNNRGNKISGTMYDSNSPAANGNDPRSANDFGTGFVLREGFVWAWVGWGADIAPGNSRLTVSFPIAMQDGRPITERILTEFCDRNFGGAAPGTLFTLPLSGSAAFKSYEAVSADPVQAEAELRARPSDSPRPSGPEIPAGELVPTSRWAFGRCPSGAASLVPGTTDLCVFDGFRNDRVYELRYRATGSPVMGLGYVTSRDFVSFLRHAQADDAGNPNPAAGIDTTLCAGISSSGMYYRDYLYQGFNADERGRRVCDAVHIHIPGVQKLFLNYRFAQPNPFTVQHRERYVPDTNFPRHYAVERDPLTGRADGILKRPATDPKVIHTDTSTEYWQFRSSLVDTDEDGTFDLDRRDRADEEDAPGAGGLGTGRGGFEPRAHPDVRRYLFSSMQHYVARGVIPTRGVGNRQCEQVSNATNPGPSARALLMAMLAWVREGRPPPESRVPRIDEGTLVPPDRASTGFPAIPGVTYTGRFNGSGERDFGPRVQGNRGVIDKLSPDVLSVHRVLVPRVDAVGNDVAGIRQPEVAAPVATLTGWNTRTEEFTAGDLCDLTGMTVPLSRTAADRVAAGDPRPSLQELYGDHAGDVKAVESVARSLAAQGLMLDEDVTWYVEQAEASSVLR
ncbi:MAG TPA: alpha/beta hydrolase domain-containing protein [Anaeromyxobacteraceae bacterium]|nr:alpha/beta hydrolase domain-containing protein [Anaeromyxobacteraceae bacterium]